MSHRLKKTFLWGFLATLGILPLVYFGGRVVPFMTSKTYFFMGAVDILVCLWVAVMAFYPEYRISRKVWLVLGPLALYLAIATISGLAGPAPLVSFVSRFETGMGVIFLWHTFAFACMAASLTSAYGKKFLSWVSQVILISSAAIAVMTFFADKVFNVGSQMLNTSMGGATTGNVLIAGAYFVFALFLGGILLTGDSSVKRKWLYGGLMVVLVFSPVLFLDPDIWRGILSFGDIFKNPRYLLGGARMVDISIAIGAAVTVFLGLAVSGWKKIAAWVGRIGLVLVVAAVSFGVWQVATPGSAANRLFLDQAAGRPIYWQVSLKAMHDRPLLGVGPENFQTAYFEHLDPQIFNPRYGAEVWTLHPHNTFLEVGVNGGILGFIAYIGMVLALCVAVGLLWQAGTISPAVGALFYGMIIAYVLQGQMLFDSIIGDVALVTIIGTVAGLFSYDKASIDKTLVKMKKVSHKDSVDLRRALVGGVCIIMVPVWLLVAYLPSRKAVEVSRMMDMPINLRPDGYQHLFHGGAAYAFRANPEAFTDSVVNTYGRKWVTISQDSDPDHRKAVVADLDGLLVQIENIWDNEPYNYRFALSALQIQNFEMMATGNHNFEKLARAKKYFDRAVSLSPTNPQTYLAYREDFAYVNDAQGVGALVDKAYQLNPFWDKAIDAKQRFDAFEKAHGKVQ